jgi:DNA replication initiation complex subunit (GINS family)
MSGRPAGTAPVPQIRTEVLKELQQILENRDQRDRLDRGPLAETKGREHWVLHLMLRAFEQEQSHINTLIGTAYSNILARFQALEDRISRVEELQTTVENDFRGRFDSLEGSLVQQLQRGIDSSVQQMTSGLTAAMNENLDRKWKPISESVETFALGSKQILKDVADTYRVATQTRLLLNENARRITDLGRDLLALEESLKLVVSKTLEEALLPFEQRLGVLEAHLGIPAAPPVGRPGTIGAVEPNASTAPPP